MQFSAPPRRRAVIPAAALAAVAMFALAGCSGSGQSSSTPGPGGIAATTITVLAPDYGNGPASDNYTGKWWDALVKEFNKQYPQITVKMDVVSWSDVDSKIISQVQAGNPPDIAQGSADWAGLKEQVYPASDVLSASTQSNLIDIFAKQGDIDGAAYGIPWVASSRALVYNKDLFAKAGITAAPTTWAEYKTDAEKLKAAGVQDPACIPLGNGDEAQAETLIWLLSNGGGYVDASGDWAVDSPANVETFQFIKSLANDGVLESSPGTTTRSKGSDSCWSQFNAGHVGMTNSHPAQIPALKKAGIDYAFAPVPGKDGASQTTLGVNDWIWAFKTKDDHQAADKAFLDFALSQKNQLSLFDEYSLLPVVKDASAQVAADNPALKPFVDSMPTDTFYPVDKTNWPTFSLQLQQVIGGAVTGDPATTLAQLQKVAAKGD